MKFRVVKKGEVYTAQYRNPLTPHWRDVNLEEILSPDTVLASFYPKGSLARAESYLITLASFLRNEDLNKPSKMILMPMPTDLGGRGDCEYCFNIAIERPSGMRDVATVNFGSASIPEPARSRPKGKLVRRLFDLKQKLDTTRKELSPPGHTILLMISNQRISGKEAFAGLMQITTEAVEDLISGKQPIDTRLANKLDLILKMPGSFWLTREGLYRAKLFEIDQLEKQITALEAKIAKHNQRLRYAGNFAIHLFLVMALMGFILLMAYRFKISFFMLGWRDVSVCVLGAVAVIASRGPKSFFKEHDEQPNYYERP